VREKTRGDGEREDERRWWRKLPHNYNKGKTIDFTVGFIDRSSAEEVAPAYARRPAPSAPPPGY